MYRVTLQGVANSNGRGSPLPSRIRPSVFGPPPWKRALQRVYGVAAFGKPSRTRETRGR